MLAICSNQFSRLATVTPRRLANLMMVWSMNIESSQIIMNSSKQHNLNLSVIQRKIICLKPLVQVDIRLFHIYFKLINCSMPRFYSCIISFQRYLLFRRSSECCWCSCGNSHFYQIYSRWSKTQVSHLCHSSNTGNIVMSLSAGLLNWCQIICFIQPKHFVYQYFGYSKILVYIPK